MGLLSIFKRGGKIAEAKANSTLDKMEDPTEMTKQGLRDLTAKLEIAVNAQATFKTTIVQLKSKEKAKEDEQADWLNKAAMLQDHLDADPTKKDQIEPLIITALEDSKKCATEADSLKKNIAVQEEKYSTVVEHIKEMRELIDTTKEHLDSLTTRQEVANASVIINKELSDVAGIDSTKALIQRMEDKVSKQEALADAWSGIDTDSATNETKINNLLKTEPATASTDLLASFRANRNKEKV